MSASWQGEMITILRHLIDDTNSDSYTYGYDRLETTLLVAAQIVSLEVTFGKTYTIDVEDGVLTPDPTTATRDDSFINLACLKAACIVLGSELKTYSLKSIRVTDGPSSIDMSSIATHLKFLYTNACEKYEQYKFNYISGVNVGGKAILTPYSPGQNFNSY